MDKRPDIHPHREIAFLSDEDLDGGMMSLVVGDEKRYRIVPHSHPHYELLFILEGRRMVKTEDRYTFAAERGDLVIFRPGMLHEEWHGSETISLFALRFSDEHLQRFGMRFPSSERCGPLLHLPFGKRFRELLERMHAETREPGINSRLLLSAYMVEFIVLLQRGLADMEAARAMPAEERIRRVADAIAADPALDADVAGLAALAEMSADHFSRRFKQMVGESPRDFLIERRMERARELLRDGDCSAQEVAAQLGYDDPYFFYRQFRDRVGCTTGEYRQRVKAGGPSDRLRPSS